MLKPAVTATLLLSFFATSASADTVTTEADTLVVVTPNAPVIVQQGGPSDAPIMAPGSPMPPAAPAAGAPQNEDWNNVSHINGTPIKVGDRGAYLHKFRKTNLSTNPFGFFFGYYDIAGARAINNNLAAQVAITAWDVEGSSGYQLSATLPLYFRRTFSGPYLEGGLLVRGDTNDNDYAYYGDCFDCNMDTHTSWAGPQLLFGWQWTFDSGLNVAMAFGMAKRLNNDSEYDNGTEGNGYFRVGYAF